MVRERIRETVNVCYFMDSFACGFETRGFAPQTVSPRRQILSHEITQPFTMFCSILFLTLAFQSFPKTKRRTDFFQAYRFRYTKKKSIRLNLFAIILFQNITCLFFPLPILLTMKRSVGSGQKYRRGTDCCFQSSTGSVKNKSVQTCRTATGLRKFAGRRCATSISLIHF